jgi:hypothetical protein
MVDVESTGTTSFDHTAIIQIAAVKFNYHTEEVSSSMFNASLSIPPGRFWDAGTREWWGKQKAGVLQGIQATARNPETVIREFYSWLMADYPTNDDGLRWWSKPSHFDYSFIASYFNQYGLTNPCHYRAVRDMNSFMAGLSGDPLHPTMEKEIPFEGDEHNALYDSFHQLKVLFAQKAKWTACETIASDR